MIFTTLWSWLCVWLCGTHPCGQNLCCGQLPPPPPPPHSFELVYQTYRAPGVLTHIHGHGFDYRHFVVTLGFVVVIITSMICLFSFPDSDDKDEDAQVAVVGDVTVLVRSCCKEWHLPLSVRKLAGTKF